MMARTSSIVLPRPPPKTGKWIINTRWATSPNLVVAPPSVVLLKSENEQQLQQVVARMETSSSSSFFCYFNQPWFSTSSSRLVNGGLVCPFSPLLLFMLLLVAGRSKTVLTDVLAYYLLHIHIILLGKIVLRPIANCNQLFSNHRYILLLLLWSIWRMEEVIVSIYIHSILLKNSKYSFYSI
jgi:hypothetical protein